MAEKWLTLVQTPSPVPVLPTCTEHALRALRALKIPCPRFHEKLKPCNLLNEIAQVTHDGGRAIKRLSSLVIN